MSSTGILEGLKGVPRRFRMFKHVSAGFEGVLEGFGSSKVSFTGVERRFKAFLFVSGDFFWAW